MNKEENIEIIEKYLENMKQLAQTNPTVAKEKAREDLIRTRVLNEDGSPKEHIVDYPPHVGYDVAPMSYEEIVATMRECVGSLSKIGDGDATKTHSIAVQALIDSGFVSRDGHVIVREKRSPQVEEFFRRVESQCDMSNRQRVRK